MRKRVANTHTHLRSFALPNCAPIIASELKSLAARAAAIAMAKQQEGGASAAGLPQGLFLVFFEHMNSQVIIQAAVYLLAVLLTV